MKISKSVLEANYDGHDMEKQYNLRLWRPEYDNEIVPAWKKRSETYRSLEKATYDVAYGEGARERIDFFPAKGVRNAPVMLYFHGGFWQRGDKEVYSFLAEPFVKNGISVAMVNYDLCPTVRIGEIAPQTRRATAWVWRNAEQLGIDRDRLFVMGHSAGGHITAMIMATDWPTLGKDLPRDLVKGGIPVSGLFELAPLIPTSLNVGLKMDEEEADAASPLFNQLPVTNAPLLVVYGSNETPDFRRQSDIYAQTCMTAEREVEIYPVPAADHFELLDVLADEESVFFNKCLRFISGPSVQLIDQIADAFNRHDLEALEPHFAEDVEMYAPWGTEVWGTRIKGKAAVLDAIAKRFASSPELSWTEGKNWVMGSKGIMEWHVRGQLPDAKKIDCLGCDLLEFRGTKIVKKDTYYKQVIG